MYKNILIPTDGTDLSAKAVKQGIAFSKSIGAKVTALTVSTPFHIFAIDPEMVEETPTTYKKHIAKKTATILGAVASAAKAAGTVKANKYMPFSASNPAECVGDS